MVPGAVVGNLYTDLFSPDIELFFEMHPDVSVEVLTIRTGPTTQCASCVRIATCVRITTYRI